MGDIAEIKLTKAMLGALEWFNSRHEPACLFDANAPSKATRKKLEERGLIECCGSQRIGSSAFRFAAYRISQAGIAAIKAREKQ